MKIEDLLRRVPREAFVPDVVWVRRDDGWAVPLRRADDPDRWLELVRSDDSIITQVDDGATELGASPDRPVADYPYGRNGVVTDPFGHRWMLTTPTTPTPSGPGEG